VAVEDSGLRLMTSMAFMEESDGLVATLGRTRDMPRQQPVSSAAPDDRKGEAP